MFIVTEYAALRDAVHLFESMQNVFHINTTYLSTELLAAIRNELTG